MRDKVRSREYVMTIHGEEEMDNDSLCHNINMKRGRQIICYICGKPGARIRKIARTYGKGKDILVIENIPVVTCPHCGESYLEADTLYEIERIKVHKKNFAIKRPVPVS